MKTKLEIDIDEIKDLNRGNENILKNFQASQLIHDITNSSDLDKILEMQESQLKSIKASLPKIIDEIMKIDRKLDTRNGVPNEIFNEFEKFLDFIPIGFLSIFIFFIIIKIIVARQMNNDDAQDKVKLIKSEARHAHDDPPITTLDYERPIEHPEHKYLDLTIDRKRNMDKKIKGLFF